MTISFRVRLVAMVGVIFGLLSITMATSGEMLRVLDTRAEATRAHEDRTNYNSSSDTYSVVLAKDPRADLPDVFTLCQSHFMANLNHPSGGVSAMNLGAIWDVADRIYVALSVDKDTEDIQNAIGVARHGFYWNFFGWFGSLRYNSWVHICVRFDTIAETITPVFEGEVMEAQVVEGLGKDKPTNLTGKLFLDVNYNTIANHLATNTQVWGRGLSVEEMVEVTAGASCGMEGDYLAWRDMEWKVGETKYQELEQRLCTPVNQETGPAAWMEVALEEVCPPPSVVRVALTQPTSWQKAHRYNRTPELTLVQPVWSDGQEPPARRAGQWSSEGGEGLLASHRHGDGRGW